jgi:predicted double-glycine peptidase
MVLTKFTLLPIIDVIKKRGFEHDNNNNIDDDNNNNNNNHLVWTKMTEITRDVSTYDISYCKSLMQLKERNF